MVSAPLDLPHRPEGTVLEHPHGPLERDGVHHRLVLHRRLPGVLSHLVQHGEVGHEGSIQVVEVLVRGLVQDGELLRVDHADVVAVDGQRVVPGQVGVAVVRPGRLVEAQGRRPVRERGAGRVVQEGEHHHGRSLVRARNILGAGPEGLEALLAVPLHELVPLPSHVPVVPDVPQANEVALVDDDGPLVVLVRHAPDAVLRVVVTGELRLPPERGAEGLTP